MCCAKCSTQDSPTGDAGIIVMKRQVRSRDWSILLDQPPEQIGNSLNSSCPLSLSFSSTFKKKAARLFWKKTLQHWLGLYQRKRMSGIWYPLLWPWPQIETLFYTVNRVIDIFLWGRGPITIPHPPFVFSQEFPATRPPVSYPEGNSKWRTSPLVKILFCDF